MLYFKSLPINNVALVVLYMRIYHCACGGDGVRQINEARLDRFPDVWRR